MRVYSKPSGKLLLIDILLRDGCCLALVAQVEFAKTAGDQFILVKGADLIVVAILALGQGCGKAGCNILFFWVVNRCGQRENHHHSSYAG